MELRITARQAISLTQTTTPFTFRFPTTISLAGTPLPIIIFLRSPIHSTLARLTSMTSTFYYGYSAPEITVPGSVATFSISAGTGTGINLAEQVVLA